MNRFKVAQFCMETDALSNYSKKNQTDKFRRLQQNFAGKCGELWWNHFLGADCECYIMTVLPKGEFRSDMVWQGISYGIKTQDPISIARFGSGRFIFEDSDPKTSDRYVGLRMAYRLNSGYREWVLGQTVEQKFINWVQNLENIEFELDFDCAADVLALDVWEPVVNGLKNKKVLISSKIHSLEKQDGKSNR